MKGSSVREAFIDRIYEIAKQDKNVVLVSADMGGLAFDKFRKNLKSQIRNVGIAEGNMIGHSTGLSIKGKKVFAYAIAPFATSRCHEFIKLNMGLMKYPITILGVGAGFSYYDSGPTHHTTEDISIMRAIPNLEILCPADSISSKKFADLTYNSKNPSYVRLDRQLLSNIYEDSETFEQGFKELTGGDDLAIITTGNMVYNSLEIYKRMVSETSKKIGVIDLYKLKPINPEFIDSLKKYNKIISLEEHLLDGGLGSIISEIITDNDLSLKLKRIGLRNYVYHYGTRENIQEKCGIDNNSVIEQINNWD